MSVQDESRTHLASTHKFLIGLGLTRASRAPNLFLLLAERQQPTVKISLDKKLKEPPQKKKMAALGFMNSDPFCFSLQNQSLFFFSRNKSRRFFRSLVCCSSAQIPDSETPKQPKKLSEQSSWESKDSEGKDYLYRLGLESENMNIAVGARKGIIDDLFVGNFLGKDCDYFVILQVLFLLSFLFVIDVVFLGFAADIVFDYRQKKTRSFEHLQGDYYIAPAFLVSFLTSFYYLLMRIFFPDYLYFESA